MKNRYVLITITLVVLSVSVVACSSGGGGSSNNAPAASTDPVPTPTSFGTPTGTVTSSIVGTAGGTFSTPDSRITISIPAGALASNTTITIQPVTNTAHGGLGDGYQILPEGLTFSIPVQITFAYTDADLEGTAPEALGAAVQTVDGYWELQDLVTTLSTTARTLTVTTSGFSSKARMASQGAAAPLAGPAKKHTSRWSMISDMRLFSTSKTILVNGAALFVVQRDYPIRNSLNPNDPLLGYVWRTITDSLAVYIVDSNGWAVNNVPNGNSTFGTIDNPLLQQAGYLAPATKPTPDTVVVSVKIKDVANMSKKYPLTARVKIIDQINTYTGNITLDYISLLQNSAAIWSKATITWTRDPVQPGDVKATIWYYGEGTIKATITQKECCPLDTTLQLKGKVGDTYNTALQVMPLTNTQIPLTYQMTIVPVDTNLIFNCGGVCDPFVSSYTMTVPASLFLGITIGSYYFGDCVIPYTAPAFFYFSDQSVLSNTYSCNGQNINVNSATWNFTAPQ